MFHSFIKPSNLQSLPVEIICLILNNLEMLDLLTCTRVAKHLRKVIMDSSRLQYMIELGKHRMVSLLPASTSPPFSSRLKLLRDRERAWKHLDWKKRHTLELPPTGSVYEFVGGLYGNGREDDSRVTASISFLELPSADTQSLGEPPQELEMWTHPMGDVTIIDFTMDPSQDLLVLVALAPPESKLVYELHLRSIRTNQPHPRAPLSILPCLLKPSTHALSSDVAAAVRVQVSGNLVALLIKEVLESTGAHLEIWNWDNSPQFSCSMTRISGIDDFTFLTRDSFLLVRPAGRFEVYTFVEPIRESTDPTLRISYAFPPLSEGYMYWYISMSSNPAPGYIPRSPTDRKRDDSIPSSSKRQIYYPSPDERIHACCLYIFNPAGEDNPHVYSFVFFLNLQSLLNPPAEWITKAASPQRNSPTFPAARRPPGHTANSETPAHPSTHPDGGVSNTPQGPNVSDSAPPNPSPSAGPTYPLFPTFDHHLPTLITQAFGRSRTPPAAPAPAPLDPTNIPAFNHRTGPARVPITSISTETSIPWDIWGPESTRWFEECLSTDWQHAIYGLRTVESVTPRGNNIFPPIPGAGTGSNPSNGMDDGEDGPIYAEAAVQVDEASAPSAPAVPSNPQGVFQAPSGAHVQPGASGSVSANPPSDNSNSNPNNNNDNNGGNEGAGVPPNQRRYLRIRDFNPYSFTSTAEAFGGSERHTHTTKGKGKQKPRWNIPRLVTAASTTPVKGVFMHDIVSSLPYMEVISQDTFEVTDVMMDDARLLLLKRGLAGKLKRVDVLMM